MADKEIRSAELQHAKLNGDALELLGIDRAHGDEIARAINLGQTHYPDGRLISLETLSSDELTSGARWWLRTHRKEKAPAPAPAPTPVAEFVTPAQLRGVVDAVAEAVAARGKEIDEIHKQIAEILDTSDARFNGAKNAFDAIVRSLASHRVAIDRLTNLFLDKETPAAGSSLGQLRAELNAVKGALAQSKGFVDRGVWQPGVLYGKHEGCTYNGSLWIAQRETSDRPPSDAWRLAAKRGSRS